jgi:hypothetical protein
MEHPESLMQQEYGIDVLGWKMIKISYKMFLKRGIQWAKWYRVPDMFARQNASCILKDVIF